MAVNLFLFFLWCIIKKIRIYSLTLFENKDFPFTSFHFEKKKKCEDIKFSPAAEVTSDSVLVYVLPVCLSEYLFSF